MDPALAEAVVRRLRAGDRLTVMSGAGISAESGIPTFRGPEGYWTVGSRVYHPQEMATRAMFDRSPREVWRWYLYRMGVCRRAAPHAGHRAVAHLERLLGEQFTLITQNVDGLHLRAGSSPGRTLQIHGNVSFMRCARECSTEIFPLPVEVPAKGPHDPLSDAEAARLVCPRCGSPSRPHVLWFDETYNEVHYRFHSALEAAAASGVLIIVGTSGATNLPNQVAHLAKSSGALVIDVNIEANVFTRLALAEPAGFFIQQPAATALPALVQALGATNSVITPTE
ncbi:MAG: Sir2 family NAD-dependent protein deacetylase [Desulfobacteraceae bacterium]|jgi:NAD-dependent deacetylase|nr:Sir2 family NAD-dependent protein deacetylase [Desulfobacteraceae bacterium]